MNLPMPLAVALMLAVGALILLAMWRGWRGLRRRGAPRVGTLATLPDAGALGAARTAPIEGTYVSSTGAGDWLDRVGAGDLGFRARAVVQVYDAGVRIARAGATDLFVPVAALVGVRLTSGMAGKYVGGKGIVVLRWTTPAADGTLTTLDTGIRTAHAADRSTLLDAVSALVATANPLPPDSNNPKESE
ncbi:hypothetical protein SAMN05216410_1369 [Sanguibacter gelidistatuariae]|uniref:PH domain-containing protein n=1 Tax=Sanguibacter gelidistatuariae TaxID=1814289 RepID=A0A1G6JM44_9MICO|nr:hypothetical protein [Sanguibacter gelidistatuariae]SDC19783.1 hypothetical protein SAMN05216410_1369 [Sanguibacter gelidistatuariae]